MFTRSQLRAVGNLPFLRRPGEYSAAEIAAAEIAAAGGAEGLDTCDVIDELRSIKDTLLMCERSDSRPARGGRIVDDSSSDDDPLAWRVLRGGCLGVSGRRVCVALVPYALRSGLGDVYRVQARGLTDFMRIIHCWRYSGVTMAGLDSALSDYGVTDEIPFSAFYDAVSTMWVDAPDKFRVIFEDESGFPTSIYGTPIGERCGGLPSIRASIDLSAHETMCYHVVNAKYPLTKRVQLLGVGNDICYILDTSARRAGRESIIAAFSRFVFPRRFFLRFVQFDCDVKQIVA
jgi:hypothetical protein